MPPPEREAFGGRPGRPRLTDAAALPAALAGRTARCRVGRSEPDSELRAHRFDDLLGFEHRVLLQHRPRVGNRARTVDSEALAHIPDDARTDRLGIQLEHLADRRLHLALREHLVLLEQIRHERANTRWILVHSNVPPQTATLSQYRARDQCWGFPKRVP